MQLIIYAKFESDLYSLGESIRRSCAPAEPSVPFGEICGGCSPKRSRSRSLSRSRCCCCIELAALGLNFRLCIGWWEWCGCSVAGFELELVLGPAGGDVGEEEDALVAVAVGGP